MAHTEESAGSTLSAHEGLEALTPSQRAWAERSERRWQRAHAIHARHPECDVSDLYHALRCLELSPSERLRNGLQRGRLRTHAR